MHYGVNHVRPVQCVDDGFRDFRFCLVSSCIDLCPFPQDTEYPRTYSNMQFMSQSNSSVTTPEFSALLTFTRVALTHWIFEYTRGYSIFWEGDTPTKSYAPTHTGNTKDQ